MIARAIAPERSRAAVKDAGSIAPGCRATRQRIEFAANARSATTVSSAVKEGRPLASIDAEDSRPCRKDKAHRGLPALTLPPPGARLRRRQPSPVDWNAIGLRAFRGG